MCVLERERHDSKLDMSLQNLYSGKKRKLNCWRQLCKKRNQSSPAEIMKSVRLIWEGVVIPSSEAVLIVSAAN